MNDIHPKLNELLNAYSELVRNVESGSLSYSDAVNTLNNLVAIDALGAEWRISENGSFLRSLPGEIPSIYQPEAFATYEKKETQQPRYYENFTDTETPVKKDNEKLLSLFSLLKKIKIPKKTLRTALVLTTSVALVTFIVNSKDTQNDSGSNELTKAQEMVNSVLNSPTDSSNFANTTEESLIVSYLSKLIGAKEMGYGVTPGELLIDKKGSYIDIYIKKDERVIAIWLLPIEEIGGKWLIVGEPEMKS